MMNGDNDKDTSSYSSGLETSTGTGVTSALSALGENSLIAMYVHIMHTATASVISVALFFILLL